MHAKKIKVRKGRYELLMERLAAKKEDGWRGAKRPGGGYASVVRGLNEWQGTSRHTCGQWPFVNGSASPIYGAQIGAHFFTREPIGFDPLAWFDHRFIFNPSVFILSNPAVGKSSLLRKMMIGVIAQGTNCLVLGDRKNEHTRLIRLMGGQIIHLGPGAGKINVLDPGGVLEAVARIKDECADPELAKELCDQLVGRMHERRKAMVSGLIGIFRQNKVSGHERSIIDQALRYLHTEEEGRVPILEDVLRVIRMAPPQVRRVANDWNDDAQYKAIVRPIENDLVGLTTGGGIGEIFNGQTTEEVRRDRSVCFDIHGIDENDKDTLAAAYIACWSAGFGMIDVAHALADAIDENGDPLERPRRFFAVMDEFWQPLAASPGMVDRVNAITRLNRDKGVGIAYASHTMADLEAIESDADKAKAKEFVARSGAVIIGGLRRTELEKRISEVVKLQAEEIELLVGWNIPPTLNPQDDGGEDMPGRGKFLIKTSEAPGVPVDVLFTELEYELDIHDTNKRIRKQARKVKA